MKRYIELRFLREMARVAKLRLRLNQQKLRFLRMVRRMATDAAHLILRMLRVDGIHVLRATHMAAQTDRVDLSRRCILKLENLRLISPAVYVLFSRSVAAFAPVPLRPLFRVQGGCKVRRIFKFLEKSRGGHICVARLARLASHVQRWILLPYEGFLFRRALRRSRLGLIRCRSRLRLARGKSLGRLAPKRNHCRHEK